jgi:hypothetical protein
MPSNKVYAQMIQKFRGRQREEKQTKITKKRKKRKCLEWYPLLRKPNHQFMNAWYNRFVINESCLFSISYRLIFNKTHFSDRSLVFDNYSLVHLTWISLKTWKSFSLVWMFFHGFQRTLKVLLNLVRSLENRNYFRFKLFILFLCT